MQSITFLLICYLFGLLAFSNAMAAPTPSSIEVLRLLGVTPHKIAELDQGEIITLDSQETTAKELAVSLAIYLQFPLNKVVDYLKSVELFAIDSEVTAYSKLPKHANPIDFKGFTFSAKQSNEVDDLLNVENEASDRFNLSSTEISSLSALQSQLTNADKNTLLKSISQQYRDFLLQRWHDYSKKGLKGIAAYARDDDVANPAAELDISAENCKVLKHFFPELFHGWINYPASLPSGIEEHFYWINRTVENRPTAVLEHTILQATPQSTQEGGALILGRQFYVGHSYNSSHLFVGLFPYRDGTLILYTESSSTDQVAGMASDLRHYIGREQLKHHMLNRLEKMEKAFDITSKPNNSADSKIVGYR